MTVSNNEVAVINNKTPATGEAPALPEQMQVKIQIQTKVQIKINHITIHLRKIPLLSGLSDEDMSKVKADLRVRHFNRRDVVLQKGGFGGRAIGLRMLKEGDFFGEIAIINSTTRSASVVALSNVLVGFLPSATALHLFSHSPAMANMMLRHLAEKIQRDSEFRALLSISNTSSRIYAYIALYKKVMPGNLEVIENLPTHHDIAMMLNTSRETVTRALLQLAQQGIIEKDLHRLIIRKPDELQKLTLGTA
jgi:CRP/FNR family transcriptional regulator, cyclic AMP receptor protein